MKVLTTLPARRRHKNDKKMHTFFRMLLSKQESDKGELIINSAQTYLVWKFLNCTFEKRVYKNSRMLFSS